MAYPSVSIPKGLYKRLKLESKKTGKAPSQIIALILSQYLDDIEDIECSDRQWGLIKAGKIKLIPLQDLD